MYLGVVACPPVQPGDVLNARGETVCQAFDRLNAERGALPRATLAPIETTVQAAGPPRLWPWLLGVLALGAGLR